MPFPDDMVKQAWERASAQCECTQQGHRHFYSPCGKPLNWDKRGRVGWGGWEAKRRVGMGPDDLANCQIVCMSCNDMSF